MLSYHLDLALCLALTPPQLGLYLLSCRLFAFELLGSLLLLLELDAPLEACVVVYHVFQLVLLFRFTFASKDTLDSPRIQHYLLLQQLCYFAFTEECNLLCERRALVN